MLVRPVVSLPRIAGQRPTSAISRNPRGRQGRKGFLVRAGSTWNPGKQPMRGPEALSWRRKHRPTRNPRVSS